MNIKHITVLAIIGCMLLLLTGCAKNYVVTQSLEQPLTMPSNCSIGEISDGLPMDTPIENKPPLEDIEKFQDFLAEALTDAEVFSGVALTDPEAQYEVVGSIIGYTRGSGTMRFLVGFGAGSAKLTIEMRLVDRTRGEIVFAGNFSQKVSNWGESGDMTFRRVAMDFAKALKKQL